MIYWGKGSLIPVHDLPLPPPAPLTADSVCNITGDHAIKSNKSKPI